MYTPVSIKVKKGLIDLLFYGMLPDLTMLHIKNALYYSAIGIAISVCFVLAYRKLQTIGYTKKQAAVFSFVSGIFAYPIGILSSRAANMFYLPPESWNFANFIKYTFYGPNHTFHTCWVLPLILCLALARFQKIRILEIFDIIFLYIPVGHTIGRIACLFVGCCWGNLTTCVIGGKIYQYYIPIPALAVFNNILIFVFLKYLFKKIYFNHPESKSGLTFKNISDPTRYLFAGIISGGYFSLYALNRFFIEFVRTEKIVAFKMTQAQIAMIIYFVIGLILFTIILFKKFGINNSNRMLKLYEK